ncbi:unnamed protein product [Parajaminaea phylloscopi]
MRSLERLLEGGPPASDGAVAQSASPDATADEQSSSTTIETPVQPQLPAVARSPPDVPNPVAPDASANDPTSVEPTHPQWPKQRPPLREVPEVPVPLPTNLYIPSQPIFKTRGPVPEVPVPLPTNLYIPSQPIFKTRGPIDASPFVGTGSRPTAEDLHSPWFDWYGVPEAETLKTEQEVVDLRASCVAAGKHARSNYRVFVGVGSHLGTSVAAGVGEVDNGSLETLISRGFYDRHATVLGPIEPTKLSAHLADGRYRRFDGRVHIRIIVEGVEVTTHAYVLEGPWDVLLGKPWLHRCGALHLYPCDWLYALATDGQSRQFVYLPNVARPEETAGEPLATLQNLLQDPSLPVDVGRAVARVGLNDPFRSQPAHLPPEPYQGWETIGLFEEFARAADASDYLPEGSPVQSVQVRAVTITENDTSSVPGQPEPSADVDTREERRRKWNPTFPFGAPPRTAERTAEVLQQLHLGDTLTEQQRAEAIALVSEFSHVFGLTATDLPSNEMVQFDIELQENAVCPQRTVRDPRLTPAEREWLVDYCHKLLDVGILRRVEPQDVRWRSDIKIVPKSKGHWQESSLEEMKNLANHGLRQAGLPFDPDRDPPPDLGPSSWVPPAGYRLVHNYIPLNKATKNVSSFPVGSMEQKVTSLAGADFYSSFDMMLGYFAIKATPRAQDLLTFFVDGLGYLTYTRMPFGPVEGPTRFNYFGSLAFGDMEQAEAAKAGGRLVRWMDDLNVASTEWSGHLRLLRTLFELCEDCGVSLSAKKTFIGVKEVKWCGNVISKKGVSSDPAKVAAIVRWGPIKTPLDALRFVNTASFLRSRIPDFAQLAAPLMTLASLAEVPDGVGRRRGTRRQALRKVPARWQWTEQEEKSFALVKAAVAFAIASVLPDFSSIWFVDCDASPTAMGVALLQPHPDNATDRQLVAVASRKCTPAEGKAGQFIREFIAIRFALDRFDAYVKGGRIVITTDCKGLRDLLNSDELSSTYARWRESLSNYDIVRFVHRPGRRNVLCDGLSRRSDGSEGDWIVPVLETWEQREGLKQDGSSWVEKGTTPLVVDSRKVDNADLGETGRQAAMILQRHRADKADHTGTHPSALQTVGINRVSTADAEPLLAQFEGDPLEAVVKWLVTGASDPYMPRGAFTRRIAKAFFIHDGELWYQSRTSGQVLRCLTVRQGKEMAKLYHESEGHFGRDLVLLHIRKEGYYWADQRESVTDAIMDCRTCQAFGPQQKATLLGPVVYPQPFDLVAVDFLRLPQVRLARAVDGVSVASYVIVFIDYFSRFVWAFLAEPTGEGASVALRRLATVAAPPKRVLSDNGSHFANSTFKDACAQMNATHLTVPVYSPWANGVVERANGLLVKTLRMFCKDADTNAWPEHLDSAVQTLNARALSIHGYSPQELLFGTINWGAFRARDQLDYDHNEPLPIDVIDIRQTLMELHRDGATATRAAALKDGEEESEPRFHLGDLVMLRVQKPKDKLTERWQGPFRVTKTFPASVQLSTLNGLPVKNRHHHVNLRLFRPADNVL